MRSPGLLKITIPARFDQPCRLNIMGLKKKTTVPWRVLLPQAFPLHWPHSLLQHDIDR